MTRFSVKSIPSSALYAGAGVLLVCVGCIPAPGADNAFYVLLPYAVAVVCVVRAALLQVRIAHNDAPSRKEDVATRPDRLKAWLFVGTLSCALAGVGELVHLALVGPRASFGYAAQGGGAASVWWMLAYVALVVAAGACLHVLRRRV